MASSVIDLNESLETQGKKYERIRADTLHLIRDLQPEDTVIQTMPDVSPTKWHLAHVTWFFECFVLGAHKRGYRPYNERFHYLFNSYYNSAGAMHPRPRRGELSRPTLSEILDYRKHVDDAMSDLLASGDLSDDINDVVTLGLHHEQQHQELLLTDIKHVLSRNPLQPAAVHATTRGQGAPPGSYAFSRGRAGIFPIGASGDAFCFDNETPCHDALVHPHEIGDRLITNSEYREFIAAGAYADARLWLSDGWATVNERGWNRPLYWDEALETEFTLCGVLEIDEHAPVCHISYYEADAFARWSGCRLPTEFEWEHAAADLPVQGNLLGSNFLHPVPADDNSQLYGDVWEWTSSAYLPYPGFKPLDGSLGEYNGKFMCNQMTVRGGSCATANDHIRASYRSFFYPDARWQFLGLRLARDGHG
jgi:ergothioneine biosynthesis protein EgtB